MKKKNKARAKQTKHQSVEIIVSQKQPMTIEDFTKATENDKSLVATKLMPQQILHIISATPREYIRKRKGRGNQEWFYVQGKYIRKKLNFIFGWAWDFEIKDKGQIDNFIWVLGRLTIKDPRSLQTILVKEQFGGAEIKKLKSGGFLDIGNDYKAAATDALKKCAAELGIASDVSEMNEHLQAGGSIIDTSPVKRDNLEKTPNYIELLREMGRKADVTHDDDLVLFVKQITGIILKDIKSLDNTYAQSIYAKMIQRGVKP